MDTSQTHISVLLQEAVAAVVHDRDGCYVDGTYGRGGHSQAILVAGDDLARPLGLLGAAVDDNRGDDLAHARVWKECFHVIARRERGEALKLCPAEGDSLHARGDELGTQHDEVPAFGLVHHAGPLETIAHWLCAPLSLTCRVLRSFAHLRARRGHRFHHSRIIR